MLICPHWTAKALQALKTPRFARARKEEQRQKRPIVKKARRAFPPAHATAAEYQANAGGKGRQEARPHAGAANATPPRARGQPAGAAHFAATTSARPPARLTACCITTLMLRPAGWPPVRRRRATMPGAGRPGTQHKNGYMICGRRWAAAGRERGGRAARLRSKAAHLADDRHCAKAAGKRRGADAGAASKSRISLRPSAFFPRGSNFGFQERACSLLFGFRCPLVLNFSVR